MYTLTLIHSCNVDDTLQFVSEFQGILTLRQQHDHPGAFGRSDIFFVCHMTPLTFDLSPCVHEIEACAWMTLDDLAKNVQTSAITLRIVQLAKLGLKNGFSEVDLTGYEFLSVYKGLKYHIYHRHLEPDKHELKSYVHSVVDSKQS